MIKIHQLATRAGLLVLKGSFGSSFSTMTNISLQTFHIRQNFLARSISMQKLTNSLTFVSSEKRKFKRWEKDGTGSRRFALDTERTPTSESDLVQKPLEATVDGGKLCVLIGWLMSKEKHLMKYGKLYLDQGFDVLMVQCSASQLLWPVTGCKVIARDMLTFMENNPQYKTLFLHAFSVGAFIWGQLLIHRNHDPVRYQFLHDRLVGQIYDSITYTEGIQQGFGSALFPNNWLLRKVIEEFIRFHVSTFQGSVTKNLLEGESAHQNQVLRSPVLIYSSETDPVAFYSSSKTCENKWKKFGIEVNHKTWKDSPHVGHMFRYPEEYKTEMKAFLDKLGLLKYPDKFQTKNNGASGRS